MPRGKKVTTIEEELPEGEETGLEAAEQDPVETQIADICSSLEGSNAKVTVKRRAPKGLTFDLVDRINVADFAQQGIEDVARKFGGGTYQLIFTNENNQYVKSVTVPVDPRLKGELDQPAGAATGDARTVEALREASAKSNEMGGLFLQMMQMQQAQHAQTMQILTAAMQQPKSSPLKDIAAAAGPFVPLIVKLIENKSADSSLKAIETIAKVKDLFGHGGESDSGDLVGQITKLLGPVLASRLGQSPPPAPVAVPSQPAGPSIPAPEVKALLEPNQDDPMFYKSVVVTFIRSKIPELVEASKANTDANALIDQLEAELDKQPRWIANRIEDALVEILSADDWAKVLFGDVTLPNPAWFDGFRKALLEEYGDAKEAPEPSAAVVPMPAAKVEPKAETAKPKTTAKA